jgi:NhaP-type Na+/H+ and K+/H+ antiporter
MRMPDISVEYVLAVFVRSGLGLLFGLFMGLAGLIVAAIVSPGGLYSLPLWLLVTAIAVGCSISGSLSYYKLETAWDIVGKRRNRRADRRLDRRVVGRRILP